MNKNLVHFGILSAFTFGCCSAIIVAGQDPVPMAVATETATSTETTQTTTTSTTTDTAATTTSVTCTDSTSANCTSQTTTTATSGTTTTETAKCSSKLPDGTVVKIPGESKVYMIRNRHRVWVKNPEQFKNLGLKWEDVKTAAENEIAKCPEDTDKSASVVTDAQTRKVYQLQNGKLIWVPTVAAFNAQGLKWTEVTEVSNLSKQYQETRYIKDSKGNVYFITNSGKKKLIVNQEVLDAYGIKAADIAQVSDEIINSIPVVKLERAEGDSKVYKIENGVKMWVRSIEAFRKAGLSWSDIETVMQKELDAYKDGQAIS